MYQKVDVDGIGVFYREAGPKDTRTILLLHGFPRRPHVPRSYPAARGPVPPCRSRSTGFKDNPICRRAAPSPTRSRISRTSSPASPSWSASHRFALYVFDYGATVGFRIALGTPDRITAIISQNGNAYEEGLSDGWNPIRAYWQEPSAANREALRSFLAPETTRWQYTHGVPDVTAVSPDGYSLDNFYLARAAGIDISAGPPRRLQEQRRALPDPSRLLPDPQATLPGGVGEGTIPSSFRRGAEAFRRDIPDATVHFFDTGHFALEDSSKFIAESIREFLG